LVQLGGAVVVIGVFSPPGQILHRAGVATVGGSRYSRVAPS
jgi:hypothetical protein